MGEPWLTLHERLDDGSWRVLEARAGETVTLTAIDATLAVDDVYRDAFEDLS